MTPAPPAPQPAKKRNTALIVVAIIAGAFALCCVGGLAVAALSSNRSDRDIATGRDTPTAADTTDADQAGVTVIATLVDFKPASRFVTDTHTSIRVEVTNASDQRIYVGPLDWFGTDVGGFKHGASHIRHEDALAGLYLNPGEATAGVITFEGDIDLASVSYQRWPTDDPVTVEVG